jgi:hypothetical protein
MKNENGRVLSRREFAQRAAMLSATASFVPAGSIMEMPAEIVEQEQASLAKLSPEGQKEVQARLQHILSLYGTRLDEKQKASIQELCVMLQPSLDRLRAYPMENGDAPALYLKPLVEREKKAQPAPSMSAAAAPKKS